MSTICSWSKEEGDVKVAGGGGRCVRDHAGGRRIRVGFCRLGKVSLSGN